MKRILLAACASLCVSFLPLSAQAGAIWLNTTGDDQWNTIGNWSADPANNTCILRGDSPPGNIYLNADHQVARIRHNNPNVWFLYIAPTNLNDATLTITGAAETFDNAAAGSTLTFDGTPNANGARPILQITGGAGSPWTQGANTGSLLVMNWEVTGSGTLYKNGLGTVILGAANTYTGPTTVAEGTLLVNGSTAATTNAFTVQTGGILGGTGTIGSAVNVLDGVIAPGASVGTLAFGSDLTLAGDLLIEVDKSLSPSPSNDLMTVVGTLTNAGTGTVIVTNLGPALVAGDSFQLFDQPLPNGEAMTIASTGGEVWTNKLAADGSIEVLSVVPPAVPATNLTIAVAGPTSIDLGGMGAANSAYDVYASTNVALPMTNWWLIGTTNSDGSGVIQFLDADATNAQRFYRFGQ